MQKINTFGKVHELQAGGDRDLHEIVAEIMSRTRLTSFEIAKPSLHDIFVRIAGPSAEEVSDA